MISDLTAEAITKAKTSAATAPPIKEEPPVEFVVKSPIYFQGRRLEAGTVFAAPMVDAVDLQGNWHVEMRDPAEAERIRKASHHAAAAHAKANKPSDGFVGRFRN